MRIHFIGIGGIGVSALARYYLSQGHEVSGSDLVKSEITEALKREGVTIRIGKHKISKIKNQTAKIHIKNQKNYPDIVIYSPAITPDNPELKFARKLQTISYPQALGELTKQYYTIAVCGTHGKSTTTSMIALTLIKAGFDPTVIVGTKLKEFGNSNFRLGKSRYLVIEADEHMASFLNYWPQIIVLTRLEADHLDYYKNLNNIFKAFLEFIGHLPKGGTLIMNGDDVNISKIKNQKSKLHIKNQKYSLKQIEANKLKKILKIPGIHNVSNALAVLAVARQLKIPDKITFQALSEYRGAWRRFEITNTNLCETKQIHEKTRKIIIVSDYGHHPTEVLVTLQAAREKYPKKKIWCVFQPHQYQRTYYLFKDFVRALAQAPVDKLIITDIYSVAGRESARIKKLVNSEKLVKAIIEAEKRGLTHRLTRKGRETIFIPEIRKIKEYLLANLHGGEVVVIMGAGDIYNLTKSFNYSGDKCEKRT